MIAMKFAGGAELAAELNKLPTRLSRSLVRESLRYAAERHLQPAMSRLAPRDTGGGRHLADEILVRTAHGPGGLPAVAVGPSRGTFYGGHLEFGTMKMAARPFARPAFDQTSEAMLQTIARDLWTELAAKGVHRTATTPSGLGGGLV